MPTAAQGDSAEQMRNRVYVDRTRVAMIRRLTRFALAINLTVVVVCGAVFFAVVAYQKKGPPPPIEMQSPGLFFPRG